MKLLSLVPVYVLKAMPPIMALRLSGDRLAATLQSLCAALDLSRGSQLNRIRRDPALAKALLVVTVKTPGGPQKMDVLLHWAIPIWLSGLNVSRLPEKKQAVALAYQRDAVAVIERALSQRSPTPEQDASPQPAEAPVDAIGKLRHGFALLVESLDVKQAIALLAEGFSLLEAVRQQEQARAAEQARKHQALAGRVVSVEEWLTALDRQVAVLRQGSAAAGQSPALGAAHQADLRTLLRLLAETTGRTQAHLARELRETFQVAATDAIPDELWPDVLAWCWWRTRQPG